MLQHDSPTPEAAFVRMVKDVLQVDSRYDPELMEAIDRLWSLKNAQQPAQYNLPSSPSTPLVYHDHPQRAPRRAKVAKALDTISATTALAINFGSQNLHPVLALLERIRSGGDHFIHYLRWDLIQTVLRMISHFEDDAFSHLNCDGPTKGDMELAYIHNVLRDVKQPVELPRFGLPSVPPVSSILYFDPRLPLAEAGLLDAHPWNEALLGYERMLRASEAELWRLSSSVPEKRDIVRSYVREKLERVRAAVEYERDLEMCRGSLPFLIVSNVYQKTGSYEMVLPRNTNALACLPLRGVV